MTDDAHARTHMTTTNGAQINAVRYDVGALCERGANVWRSSVQTLLVAAGCGGVLGLLSGRARLYPGSPRLGSADPGLNYATPLGLVWRGAVGGTGRIFHFQNNV